MSSLVRNLGVSPNLAFHDVFSIDDPDLLAFVPRPAYAMLLVFPVSASYERFRREEDADKPEYQGHGPGEPVTWFKQTIRNACGLIGLLHAVSNGEAKNFIGGQSTRRFHSGLADSLSPDPSSPLSNLLVSATSLPPAERAELLYGSSALETAHQAAAVKGDSMAPSAEASIDLHYVCFVKTLDNQLWELDGRRRGPLDRGVLEENEDVLSENALKLGVRRFLKREEEAGGGEMRFSLVVLGPSLE